MDWSETLELPKGTGKEPIRIEEGGEGSEQVWELGTCSIVEVESTHVTHIGTVKLSNSLILKHVLCVPFFSFNLVSVSQLTQSLPFCLVFLSQSCFI